MPPRLRCRVHAPLVAALVLAAPFTGAGQTGSLLRITVTLMDAGQKPTPVPRHVLLVSDNPASTAPRRIVTAADGTASVRLAPGNYTVESDRPAVFQGREYQWTQTLDVAAGRDVTLELTAANAEVGEITATTAAPIASAADPSDVLTAWQASVVALWTPTARASGFVIDARGLLATNQQVVGNATSVEVQLTPAVKVTGRVLAGDPRQRRGHPVDRPDRDRNGHAGAAGLRTAVEGAARERPGDRGPRA